jgi:N-acetylmuramate 1-kinase
MDGRKTVDAVARLRAYLDRRSLPADFTPITPDASTREYFRIRQDIEPAIACVYEQAGTEAQRDYVDVTRLFLHCGLAAAAVYDVDDELGIVIMEDLGDRILRDVINGSAPERADSLINDAIRLIVKIQAGTPSSFELSSIASERRFDFEKLSWELQFFMTHYFGSLRSEEIESNDLRWLNREFDEICNELDAAASVLCHRDFHSANLMMGREGSLRIIDHQDARIGAVSYDLVSLLTDRVAIPPPGDVLRQKQALFLSARVAAGLASIEPDEFSREFDLQTIQRSLKAVGTFSYQTAHRAKTQYYGYISSALQIALAAGERLQRFPVLQRLLGREIDRPL